MRQIVYVTGGGELTVTSTAAASAMTNVRFEVIGYTSLALDVPNLTMTGIYQSVSGGSGTHVFIFFCLFSVGSCSLVASEHSRSPSAWSRRPPTFLDPVFRTSS